MTKHNPERTVAYWADRAAKAERERDEARARLAGVTIAVPDITVTDEMVERAHAAAARFGTAADISASATFAMLTAALTEPPKRPEGAEEIESAIRAWDENGDTNADHGDWDNLADFLASRGVRVTGSES